MIQTGIARGFGHRELSVRMYELFSEWTEGALTHPAGRRLSAITLASTIGEARRILKGSAVKA